MQQDPPPFPLPRGYVGTVEPGVYFIPLLLDAAKGDAALAPLISWAKVEGGGYRAMGGVRLEDVVAIGLEDGAARILSRPERVAYRSVP